MNNKTVYTSYDFDLWVNRAHLLNEENYFLSKYLIHPEQKTLEAGTGGGRIAYSLEEQGFSDIVAFDFVEQFIHEAKSKKPLTAIDFWVADAVNLQLFDDNTFDQAIYLQQIISLVPYDKIDIALLEACRVLKPSGHIVFSVLNWNGRSYNSLLSIAINTIRFLRGEELYKQLLPWLRLGGKFNWRFLFSNQPLTYWFTKQEIVLKLDSTGFEILEIKTSSEFTGASTEGMIYIACRKKF
jgi:ubiquinone/menaquinone biosynthesis C-methylase UbiE